MPLSCSSVDFSSFFWFLFLQDCTGNAGVAPSQNSLAIFACCVYLDVCACRGPFSRSRTFFPSPSQSKRNQLQHATLSPVGGKVWWEPGFWIDVTPGTLDDVLVCESGAVIHEAKWTVLAARSDKIQVRTACFFSLLTISSLCALDKI